MSCIGMLRREPDQPRRKPNHQFAIRETEIPLVSPKRPPAGKARRPAPGQLRLSGAGARNECQKIDLGVEQGVAGIEVSWNRLCINGLRGSCGFLLPEILARRVEHAVHCHRGSVYCNVVVQLGKVIFRLRGESDRAGLHAFTAAFRCASARRARTLHADTARDGSFLSAS